MIWVFVLFVLLAVPLVLLGSTQRRAWKRAEARRTHLLEAGDLEAWFNGLGMTVTPTSPWEGGTRAVGMGGDLTVLIGCASFSAFVPRTPFEVRLDLSRWVDLDLSVKGAKWTMTDWGPEYRGAPVSTFIGKDAAGDLFHVGGEMVRATVLASTSFGRHVLDLYTGQGLGVKEVELRDGVLTVTHGPMYHLLQDDEDAIMGRLLAILGALREDLSSRGADAAVLAASVRDDARSFSSRVKAAGLLATRMAGEGATRVLADDLDALGISGRAACLFHGQEGVFARSPRERVAALRPFANDPERGEEVVALLEVELAWHTLLDPVVGTSRRMSASERAYGAPDMPEDATTRDQDLVGLLTSAEGNRKLAVSLVFKRLVEAGWVPHPDAAFLLARDGERVVREVLLEWLGKRDDVESYRGALAALERARVPGAAKLVGTLEPSASDGMLSLAEDDGTRGALSQAVGVGALSPTED